MTEEQTQAVRDIHELRLRLIAAAGDGNIDSYRSIVNAAIEIIIATPFFQFEELKVPLIGTIRAESDTAIAFFNVGQPLSAALVVSSFAMAQMQFCDDGIHDVNRILGL